MELALGIVTSRTRESVIGDCIKSAIDLVDQVVIVEGWEGDDATLEVAASIAGDKLVLRKSSEFTGHWRDAALRACEDTGADWALILDTDERLLNKRKDLRRLLETMPAEIENVLVPDQTNSFRKRLFIRLPAKGHWVGSAHEDYVDAGHAALIEGVTLCEVPKTLEQLRIRSEKDLPVLDEQLLESPDNPRLIMYRGIALEFLDRLEEAIINYSDGANRNIPEVWKAYLLYRGAKVFFSAKEYELALKNAAMSLRHCPRLSEASLLAGLACMNLGRLEDAVAWSRFSLMFKGEVLDLIFREPTAIDGSAKKIIQDAKKLMKH